MVAIVIFGAALGAVLGSHFKIFILGPAMLFAAAAALAVDFVRDVRPSTIVLAIVSILASLQFGYLTGGIATAYLSMRFKRSGNWTPTGYL
jgi:hypothetical protein